MCGIPSSELDEEQEEEEEEERDRRVDGNYDDGRPWWQNTHYS